MRGKVVLITGASSGIGAGTASHFASLGCLLSLTGRNQDGLRETLGACIQAGCKEEDVLLISADLQDTNSLASIVKKTVDKFGKLDVLINNAGFASEADLENTTAEVYDGLMNTNTKSVFFLTQSAMPHLIESKGSVVNVSSAAGNRPTKDYIVYAMSKAALEHFTKIVALDVAGKGVRVNAISPGLTKTPMATKSGVPEFYDLIATKATAMKRGGTVDEMAKAITFLADNDQSSFVTGVVLSVDGGFVLMGPM